MANYFTTKQLRKLMEISKEPLFTAQVIKKAYKITQRQLNYLDRGMNFKQTQRGKWHRYGIVDLFWFQILVALRKKLVLKNIIPVRNLIETIFNVDIQFKNLVDGERVFIILKDEFYYIWSSIDDVSDFINNSDGEVCVILPVRFAFRGWENLLQKGTGIINLG